MKKIMKERKKKLMGNFGIFQKVLDVEDFLSVKEENPKTQMHLWDQASPR